MLIALMALGALSTALLVAWLLLLLQSNQDDRLCEAYTKILRQHEETLALAQKDEAKQRKIEASQGLARALQNLLHGKGHQKEIAKLQRSIQQLQSGRLGGVNILVLPGYAAQRRFRALGRGELYKLMFRKNQELYGKKHASNTTKHLIASMVSYLLLGLGLVLCLGAMLLSRGMVAQGAGLCALGAGMVGVLVYAMYDEVSDRIAKRHEAIERQFPNVVSKLALLVSSGMILNKAWRETAFHGSGQLYTEMRVTADEMDQNLGTFAAFSNFIGRCNTKETTKLATAIMQGEAKGNSEIGRTLRDMSKESWQERKHSAKRNAEKVNAKLIIPTMLMFVTILIIIMVPVATSFSSL